MRHTLIFLLALLVTPIAQADFSGNIGWQSHYLYRGIPQSRSSAQGGVDYETDNWNIGAWAADVGMGAEIDVYGGYNWTFNDFSFGAGATGYYYTDDFDDTYTEINLSAGYDWVTLDYAAGQYENFAGPRQDYEFISATFVHDSGVYGVIGSFGADFDGNYYSAGYDFEVNDIELSIGWIYSDDTLSSGGDRHNIVFGIAKSFSISK